ncbi:unnamed protein product [Acanthosepion pharaonis]|uniref:Uncharacterized protein n=1 Tax=Acanthosepion pharaonis TaxID=158019 RepID=A0A812DGX6_ACAPH|nr:unnamed protein product [Sepia pharaonis]
MAHHLPLSLAALNKFLLSATFPRPRSVTCLHLKYVSSLWATLYIRQLKNYSATRFALYSRLPRAGTRQNFICLCCFSLSSSFPFSLSLFSHFLFLPPFRYSYSLSFSYFLSLSFFSMHPSFFYSVTISLFIYLHTYIHTYIHIIFSIFLFFVYLNCSFLSSLSRTHDIPIVTPDFNTSGHKSYPKSTFPTPTDLISSFHYLRADTPLLFCPFLTKLVKV